MRPNVFERAVERAANGRPASGSSVPSPPAFDPERLQNLQRRVRSGNRDEVRALAKTWGVPQKAAGKNRSVLEMRRDLEEKIATALPEPVADQDPATVLTEPVAAQGEASCSPGTSNGWDAEVPFVEKASESQVSSGHGETPFNSVRGIASRTSPRSPSCFVMPARAHRKFQCGWLRKMWMHIEVGSQRPCSLMQG